MKALGCREWARLSDRAALAESLTPSEQTALVEHAAGCAACAAEQSAFDALGRVLSDPALLTQDLNLSKRAVARGIVPRVRELFGERSRTARAALAFAATLALTAGLFGMLRARTQARALQRNPASSAFKANVLAANGQLELDGKGAVAGDALSAHAQLRTRRGRGCLAFEPGVLTCLAAESEAGVDALGARRVLRLVSGRVLAKLEHQPQGMTFAVATSAGLVLAKGTVFAVEALATKGVSVRVYEGTVLLERPSGESIALSAPAMASFGASEEKPHANQLTPGQDEDLIELASLFRADARQKLAIEAWPPGAHVRIDGVDLGEAPLSALISGGHRVSVERDGYAPLSERVWLQGSEATSKRYELALLDSTALETNAATSEPSSARAENQANPTTKAGERTASELLAHARILRAKGNYREARAAYRRLLTTYPRSDEARVSRVSLGELSLSELGDANAALAEFDAYLKGGGALAQEAAYGRIRALERLGRSSEARAASERFVHDYPKSVQAASLRRKLSLP